MRMAQEHTAAFKLGPVFGPLAEFGLWPKLEPERSSGAISNLFWAIGRFWAVAQTRTRAKLRRYRPSKMGPVGVFDSGVGGLSVLRELLQLAPDLPVIYLADQVMAPYGERSLGEVRARAGHDIVVSDRTWLRGGRGRMQQRFGCGPASFA